MKKLDSEVQELNTKELIARFRIKEWVKEFLETNSKPFYERIRECTRKDGYTYATLDEFLRMSQVLHPETYDDFSLYQTSKTKNGESSHQTTLESNEPSEEQFNVYNEFLTAIEQVHQRAVEETDDSFFLINSITNPEETTASNGTYSITREARTEDNKKYYTIIDYSVPIKSGLDLNTGTRITNGKVIVNVVPRNGLSNKSFLDYIRHVTKVLNGTEDENSLRGKSRG